MFAKTLIRSTGGRFRAIVVWAMVPLVAIGGQSISGCMSADGQIDPSCQCWAPQAPQSGKTAAVHQCHCSCCGTANCCCKNKKHCCNSVAGQNTPTKGEGYQNSGHCRPVAVFLAVTTINNSQPTGGERPVLNALLPVAVDVSAIVNSNSSEHIVQFNTGPPPDNLVVSLHRWVI